MGLSARLANLQAMILDQVASAASSRDLARVAQWSEAAKECDRLVNEARKLEAQTNAFEESVRRRLENPRPIHKMPELESRDKVAGSLSAKQEGVRARSDWLKTVQSAASIRLTGSGKRYRTARQLGVGIAFANELAERPRKWFLGLPDEQTDVVVLLCRALDRSMHDLVLPLADLGDLWKQLSRSKGQVKFHVEQKDREFYLVVPRGEPLVVTKYKANYRPLQ